MLIGLPAVKLDIEPTVVLVSICADQGPPEHGENGAAESGREVYLLRIIQY